MFEFEFEFALVLRMSNLLVFVLQNGKRKNCLRLGSASYLQSLNTQHHLL